ncbi:MULTISPECIES: hypothetical protein [unclassified Pseudoalteromonas]|uniref:hypothetical protein n=1 Tax=unclassified Pseudoalteromonas TaxID=194690 RepID=UPI001603196A|nr:MULTISPECIES: hypothetical protein [unclassified Pseudoalteromonas]MBB1295459.1 hypothetical protein [Pseudoalteromonas sp. SR41-4]MBB1410245.1 hypothetical protein [Pseudoalteromonas sp. SG44-17]MBB1470632.1 hypothetical protein [Pseudoalteromonas sp. SG41-5]
MTVTKCNLTIDDIFGEGAVDAPKYLAPESRARNLALFSSFPERLARTRIEKFNFYSVQEIPICSKYKPPTKLRFIKTDQKFCGSKLVTISVGIKKLIAFNEEHFLSLHAERYDKVKNAIANGEIDMPMVYLSEEKLPYVGDGRHRIIALHKFDFSSVEVMVPADKVDTIKKCFL